MSDMINAQALAAFDGGGSVRNWDFHRRVPRTNDVLVDIEYCGICHSDLHAMTRPGQVYPFVPGHEIVGRVREVGKAVERFAQGDRVAIGTIVDSCRTCSPCLLHEESYCEEYPVTTYGGKDRIDGSRTQGGYSNLYVADADFVYHVPHSLDPAAVAPLLCAGITTFAPLRQWQAGPGKTVGVIGIGGLGHMGLKLARAMGAYVVAFTTSPDKVDEARRLGAHECVLSTDAEAMRTQANRFDLLLSTASYAFPMDPFLQALKLDGTLCSLGIPDRFDFRPVNLTLRRRNLSSSGTGGTDRTREMLDFCAEHGIVADIELVKRSEVNDALRRLKANDVRYRFVIDMTA